jgi:hypothetical protein
LNQKEFIHFNLAFFALQTHFESGAIRPIRNDCFRILLKVLDPSTGSGSGSTTLVCRKRSMCYGNVLCAGPELFSPVHNPILYGIAKSFACFRTHHDLLHSNFTKAFIINNNIFTRGPRDKGILTYSYLELDETAVCRISQLTACDFFNVNGLKTRLELTLQYGINLTIPGYARLALCLNNYVRKLSVAPPTALKEQGLRLASSSCAFWSPPPPPPICTGWGEEEACFQHHEET